MTPREALDFIRETHPGDCGPDGETFSSDELEQAFHIIDEAFCIIEDALQVKVTT